VADLVVSDEGERYLLDRLLKAVLAVPADFKIGLYKNDYTPLRDWTISNLAPCDFPGYVPQTLDPNTWSDAVTLFGSAQSLYGSTGVTFACSSGTQIVYGYYVFDSTGGVGLWAQRFAAPIIVSIASPVVFQPTLRAHSESEPV
jgi:hypothetical protein